MADVYATRAFKVIKYDAANPRAFVTAVATDRAVLEAKITTTPGGVAGIHLVLSLAPGESGEQVDVTLENGDYLRVSSGIEVITAAAFAREWTVRP